MQYLTSLINIHSSLLLSLISLPGINNWLSKRPHCNLFLFPEREIRCVTILEENVWRSQRKPEPLLPLWHSKTSQSNKKKCNCCSLQMISSLCCALFPTHKKQRRNRNAILDFSCWLSSIKYSCTVWSCSLGKEIRHNEQF